MFEDKVIVVIRDMGMYEDEIRFTADTFPMAKHFADKWAKQNGFDLIKSPAKIAETYPACRRVACNKNEIIWYVK